MTRMWTVLGFRSFDIKFLKVKLNHLRKSHFSLPLPPEHLPVPLPTSSSWGHKAQENPVWPGIRCSFSLVWIPPSCFDHSSSHPSLRSRSRCLLTLFILFVSAALPSNFFHMVKSLPHKMNFFPIKNAPSDWGLGKSVHSNVWHTAYKDGKALIFITLVVRE